MVASTKISAFVKKNWSAMLFVFVIFFTSCCFIDNTRLMFFFTKFKFRWLKIALAVVLPFLATVIDYTKRKSLVDIGDKAAWVMTGFSVLFVLDSLTLRLMWQIDKAIAVFHLLYGALTFMSVLLCTTLITLVQHKRGRLTNYNTHYRTFLSGFGSVLFVCFAFIYFVNRKYGDVTEVNLIPFQGEFSIIVKKGFTNAVIRDVGNVLFFSALSLMLIEFFDRHRIVVGIIIPFALSVVMEIFQYIAQCGDPDIDDIIANTMGAVLGYAAYHLIIKGIKEKELC